MFKKIIESKYEDYYKKMYSCDSSISDAMDIILNSGISFSKVRVIDSGDVGMKFFGGEYSFDDFMIIYDKIKFDIDSLSLEILDSTDSIHISAYRKNVILLTADEKLELNELIKNNTKKMNPHLEYVSFSETDKNNHFNEAYGYFRESSIAEMFNQLESEENTEKKTK